MSPKIVFAGSAVCSGLLALCLALGAGCSSSGGAGSPSDASAGGAGSGGSSASGGKAGSSGSGGSKAAGGAGGGGTASGGKSASGGATAGAGGSAGSAGNGGQTGGAGSAGNGGQTGGAGSGGSGGQTGGAGSAGNGGQTGGAGSAGSGGQAGGAGGVGGSAGAAGAAGAGGSAAGGSGGNTNPGGTKPSEGCGKAPATLKSATAGQTSPVNSISVGGKSREFLVRWPSGYKNDTPYRLHIGMHGYGGTLAENGKDNFGLWSLSKDTTIFVTLAAVGGAWDLTGDLAYADEVLKKVESELCIDTSRVMLEGFSQGGAMAWALTCSRPGVYRAVVGHSAGSPGFSAPSTCPSVAYLGSLGLSDVGGNSQATQTDLFAKANGCTIENLPTAPKGGHICTPYKGCKDGFPVIWCSYDGGHGFTPVDSGKSSTWMPAEVWSFLSPL